MEVKEAQSNHQAVRIEQLNLQLAEKDNLIQRVTDDLHKIKEEFTTCYLQKVFGNETIEEGYEVLLKEMEKKRRVVQIHQVFKLPFNIGEADLKVTNMKNMFTNHSDYIYEKLQLAFSEQESLANVSQYIITKMKKKFGGGWLCFTRPAEYSPAIKLHSERMMRLTFTRQEV